jgi:hypothetical protein
VEGGAADADADAGDGDGWLLLKPARVAMVRRVIQMPHSIFH